MAKEIRYSAYARKDLDKIWDYIANDLCNKKAAQDTINGILKAVDELAEFPEMGSKLYIADILSSRYRYVQYKNYMAFYRVNKDEILVDRILYSKRNYLEVLF
ncbi:MAG: type II toxin-antitoxin system RelE/ParE family toxin [Lachnospiraceae bacterium]|nr:type II toxin-antitoxin system RelE/ParE family toxin [Lachnospiraceae bacterium]